MNTEQRWREEQLSRDLWEALAGGNTGRVRQLLNPANHTPNGLQTYLEPALSDGEKILRDRQNEASEQ